MKCAIIQQRVFPNQVSKNFETIKKYVLKHKDSADIIIFPEMAVGGYFVGDKYNLSDFQDELLSYNEEILKLSKGTAIIWGNLAIKDKKRYNAAYFAIDGKWAQRESGMDEGVYFKHLLPTYGFFDDHRYFTPDCGNFEPFVLGDKKVSIQVCEDLWDQNSSVSPTQEMMKYNPDIMINISTSPWIKGKESLRLENIKRQNLSIPYIYVNTVGIQNSGKNVMMFDGGSYVVDGDKVYALSDNFVESDEIVDTNNIQEKSLNTHNKLYKGLIKTIQYFDEECLPYGPKWVVGVSGGLDSSVTVALLVEALGKDRVIGVTMPSKFTGDQTKSNAYHLAKKLGIQFMEIPIGSMVDATVESLPYKDIKGLSYENIQARLRGHTLMSIASLENGVVSNNGNKIEVALGYATLYGDAIGALAILGDLTKMEVGEVARSINAHEEIVPNNIIPIQNENEVSWGFAPSAELASGQFDPMKWGYHDALIPYLQKHSITKLLESYCDGSLASSDMGKYLNAYGLSDGKAFIEDLKWVLKTMNTAVYKRIQMPPIVSISDEAYGIAYRESQMPLTFTKRQIELMNLIKNKA